MNGSTLHPGKTSRAIEALRNAAIAEMDKPEKGIMGNGEIRFDVTHRELPNHESLEDTVGAATYRGPNSPHIGNGSGGPR